MATKIFFKLLAIFVFGLPFFAFALDCPSETTVKDSQTILFVGQVADMGGDKEVFVWFEYGTSSQNYTQKTQELRMTKPGKYCIEVSNLQPCTTYYYRAGMRNKAGEVFGQEKSKTTLCEKVLGEATTAPTGFSDSFFFSLFLPLILAGALVFFLRSKILNWEKFLEKKEIEWRKFKAPRELQQKIKKYARRI